MSDNDYTAGQVFMQHRVLNMLEKERKRHLVAQGRLLVVINAFTRHTPPHIKQSCQNQMRGVMARLVTVEEIIARIRRLRRRDKSKGETQ